MYTTHFYAVPTYSFIIMTNLHVNNLENFIHDGLKFRKINANKKYVCQQHFLRDI